MNRIGFEGSYGIVAEFIQNLPDNILFIDIGANQGCTSILASKVLTRNKKNRGVVIWPLNHLYQYLIYGIKDLFDSGLVRKVIIEIDNNNLNKYGNNSEEVYKFFDKYGFNATIGHKQGHYDEVFSE